MPRPRPAPTPSSSPSIAAPSARRRPQLANLAYDAVSLVALLSPGPALSPLHPSALMDPNGFAGVNGIFRFNADGTSERGLAVLEMTRDGPRW